MTEPGKAMAPGGDQDWQALVPLDALSSRLPDLVRPANGATPAVV